MEEFITDLFMRCVYVLQWLGGNPGNYGYGYYVANIVVFIVVEPVLIALFFSLWMNTKRKLKKLNDDGEAKRKPKH